MAIPKEINVLIEQLYQELAQIEQETAEGLRLIRILLSRFPENTLLIQFFAYLNSVVIFVENSRGRIQTIVEDISAPEATEADIQEVGEELATRLGTFLDAKIAVSRIIVRLENLL